MAQPNFRESLRAPRCEPPLPGVVRDGSWVGKDARISLVDVPGGGKRAALGSTWLLVHTRCVCCSPSLIHPAAKAGGCVGDRRSSPLALSLFLLLKREIKWCWSKEPSVRIAAAPSLCPAWDKGEAAGGR